MAAPERVVLPDGEASLSRLAAGCWRLLQQTSGDVAVVQRFIEHCLALGISTFDHADVYGRFEVEELFGRALRNAPHLRPKIELVTKCSIAPVNERFPEHRVLHLNTTTAYITGAVERSLRAFGTETIDLMLIHRPDLLMDADEVAAAMERLRQDGKVRNFGVSNFTFAQFGLLQESVPFRLAAIQIELSVLKSRALIDGTLADAQRRRIASMFWSPLGGGRLFKDEAHAALLSVLTRIGRTYDVSAAAVALAWLLRLPGGSVPVLGSSEPGRIDELAKARGIVLDRQDWYEIYAASGQTFA